MIIKHILKWCRYDGQMSRDWVPGAYSTSVHEPVARALKGTLMSDPSPHRDDRMDTARESLAEAMADPRLSDIEQLLAPLHTRIRDLEERVAALESREIIGPTNPE